MPLISSVPLAADVVLAGGEDDVHVVQLAQLLAVVETRRIHCLRTLEVGVLVEVQPSRKLSVS